MVHGCMVYTERAETAAVSCGTTHASAVSTPLRWIFKNALQKASHSCRITCERNESARERRIALYKKQSSEDSFKCIKKKKKKKKVEKLIISTLSNVLKKKIIKKITVSFETGEYLC